jgi:hypothetical protein
MTAPTPPMTDEEFNSAVRADPTAHTAYVEAIRARAAATELRRALEFAHEWMDLEGHDCDSECVVRAALEKNGGGK